MRQSKFLRHSVALAAVVAALTVGAASVVSAQGFAPGVDRTATSTAACPLSHVVNWLDTTGSGAAGSFIYALEFTNLSGHTCTIAGYPGVSAVTLTGGQFGSPASRSAGAVHVVVLTKGQTARATLTVTDTGNYSTATCQPVTAAGLRVYAPNAVTSDVIPYPFSTCAKSGTVSIHVGPVRAS